MPHPHEGGYPSTPPVLVGAEDLLPSRGNVVFTPEDQLVLFIHLPRVRQRHLPATDAVARKPLLLDTSQDQFAEIPAPNPAEDLMGGDLSLDPHDPVPSRNEPLHLAQQFDRRFEVVGGVPSRLKLPREGGAADNEGGIDLHHVGPECFVAEEPLQVLKVALGVCAREARHHVGGDLQPRVARGSEGSDGIIRCVAPIALCEHLIPQGLDAYL